MTVYTCRILTPEIIGFFTAVIYHGKLPQYFYNIGTRWRMGPRYVLQLSVLKVAKLLITQQPLKLKKKSSHIWNP
jgi:hypothetical protein